ncbi:MAG: hypothetical protein JSS22_03935, partial [Proteobacteria bacterium]|nr:hypothetical protein [Pseudomonadota bacterium]
RGLAVTDPLSLRELDLREHRGSGSDDVGFGIRSIFDAAGSSGGLLRNDALFALPSMAPVRKAIDAEFDRYIAEHKAGLPGETIGVGNAFDFQLFDRDALYSGKTRFVLAGIVNRMDRAYVSPQTCGEIRLIYRLTRIDAAKPDDGESSPRLPMTLNAVFSAKDKSSPVSCAEIARRWLATADLPQSGIDLAIKLMSPGGPLALLRPENLFRIETNLQIAHAPKSAVRDFRTDYLLNVFDYDKQAGRFEKVRLENQIDRARIMSDPALAAEFRRWLLLAPDHLAELDRGTLVLPDAFLATGAIAPTPVGFAPSEAQPAFGLVRPNDTKAVFPEPEVVTALQKAAARGVAFQNIRSVAGFERRLNDITCAGCHQTRGIGGFHFPGVDWMAAKPDNSVVVPASPHFFGDQVRRRDILTAMRDGRTPDFSRGFSDRPQLRGTRELAGTEYDNGWGAHCYDSSNSSGSPDRSFRSWTCAKGL